MKLIDVVRKLTGPIDPQGETHLDDKRLENLKVVIGLAEELHRAICDVAISDRGHDEYSIRKAAIVAREYLAELREELAEEKGGEK